MKPYLYTLATDGDVEDEGGKVVLRLNHNADRFLAFVEGVRIGQNLPSTTDVVRQGDFQAWLQEEKYRAESVRDAARIVFKESEKRKLTQAKKVVKCGTTAKATRKGSPSPQG